LLERLIELFLGGGLKLPLFDPDLLALDRDFPKSDLFALLVLQRRGEVAMSELAADLNAPLSTVTGIGTRLARRGLIQRGRDPQDRRVWLMRLTPVGEALADRVRHQIDELIRKITSVLTEEEIQQVTQLVFRVITALQQQPAVPEGPDQGGVRTIPID
jgi:DNA-binding MarR family transcriptional regulator